jgi:anti-anti-sigma factor
MSFAFKVRKADDVVIMDFSGRFTIGKPVAIFREAVRLQMDQGARKFVWNLREVEIIDSAALGEMVSAYTWVRSKGGEAKLLLREGSEPWAESGP